MRNAHRKAKGWDNFDSSTSETNINPPWCYSGKVSRRKLVPKCEIQSSYPLRENIWEYLHNGEKFKCSKRRGKVAKQRKERGKTTLLGIVFLLLIAGIIAYLWSINAIPSTQNLMDKLISRTKLLSVRWKSSVSEECCHKMKYLVFELSRTEHNLRNTLRLRRVTRIHPVTESSPDSRYIEGAVATRGSDTNEWDSRVALWGVVPLWKAAPPPNTVLSLRAPMPADCWPFRGSSGELIIQLPNTRRVSRISIEHIRPDTAKSAPKNFTIYGILANNTMVKVMDNQYQRNGPAKQYFTLGTHPVMSIIFRVLTNHGNVKYTCIYRIHLYENDKIDF